MNTKTTSTKLIKILISLIAVAILGTIGCSGSSMNPVGTNLENSDDPGALTAFDPMIDSETAPNTEDRSVQIFWFENPEAPTEPNNDQTTAHQVFHAQCFNGNTDSVTDQNDYYKIRLVANPGSIYVKLSWTDPVWINLYIYDADLNPISYDNYEGSGPKELFAWELPSGDYYIRVKAFEGGSDYQIKFGVGRQYYEPANDSMFTTTWNGITGGGEYLRSVVSETEDQLDHFVIEVPEDYRIAVSLDWVGLAGTNLDLTVYDSMGGVIESTSSSACPEALSTDGLAEGTYYLAVEATTGQAIYHLEVQVLPVIIWIDPDIYKMFKVPLWWPPEPPWQLDLPDWGDPTVDEGPFPMPSQYMYAGPGGPSNPENQHDIPNNPQFGY